METGILTSLEMSIPLYMVIAYVFTITICLLFKRIQLGLAVSFLFVLYMGYFYNRTLLVETVKGSFLATSLYGGLGLLVFALTIVSFLSHSK